MGTGLYIHVPFCLARCDFCAFSLQIFREDNAQRYVKALCREIQLHAEDDTLRGRSLGTVYFGGGTPTTLQPHQLCDILEKVKQHFRCDQELEVTVEAHPDTVTSDGLRLLVGSGFNRLSLGVQSLVETELSRVGRPTLLQGVGTAVTLARQAGFRNLNLDFIYGLPGQTTESWISTLDEALALEPTHLSCYALTVEERTKLDLDLRKGSTPAPDPVLQNAMEITAAQRLREAGFTRYEISNYARPGYACRHNLLYWEAGDYLGLGPSAQSFIQGRRFGNEEKLSTYARSLEEGRLAITEEESLTPEQQQREAIVFGLRLTKGIDRSLVAALTEEAWHQARRELLDHGLLEEGTDRIRLTDEGRRYADSVAVELL